MYKRISNLVRTQCDCGLEYVWLLTLGMIAFFGVVVFEAVVLFER